MFPRIAIHTGNTVVTDNKHPEWEGTVVIQHNETTMTMIRHGKNLSQAARKRHPILSVYQGKCRNEYWQPYTSIENDIYTYLFGQPIQDGEIPEIDFTAPADMVGVEETRAH